MLTRYSQTSLMLKLLFCIVLSLFTAQLALSATVVGKSKKKGVVKIDEGTEDDFVKGAVVCFHKPDGKKVTCGKIKKAKGDSAYVKVRKKRLKRIKKGMEARLKGAAGDSSSTASGKTDHRNNIKLGWNIAPSTPTTYNVLSYNAPEANAEANTLDSTWKTSQTNGMALAVFTGEGEFGIGESMAMSLGLRMRTQTHDPIEADYNKGAGAMYSYLETSSSAMAFYMDFTYVDIPLSKTMFWRLSSGLGYEASTLSFKATQKEDGTEANIEIASATSKCSTISLRLGTNLNWMMVEPVGIVFGFAAEVPVSASTQSSSTVSDKQATGTDADGQTSTRYLKAETDPNEDLTTQLGHGKGSFGLEIIMGTYIAF